MKGRFVAVALVLGASLALPHAAAQGVLADKGEIRFVSKQMGVKVEGRFKKWKADVVFLPADLAKSRANVEVDVLSIDLASAESENELRGPEWFDSKKIPVARFTSKSIRSLGADRYEVAGQMSIKGINRDLTFPVTLTRDASGNRTADASFTLKRLDYNIGEGAWKDTEMVANEVAVTARFLLPPEK